MKTNEVKIGEKDYQYKADLDLLHILGDDLKTEDLGEIMEYYNEIVEHDNLTFKTIPKLAKLVRFSILNGCKEEVKQKTLENWVVPNLVSATKVFNAFMKSLPGNGESDKELVDPNTEALEKGA